MFTHNLSFVSIKGNFSSEVQTLVQREFLLRINCTRSEKNTGYCMEWKHRILNCFCFYLSNELGPESQCVHRCQHLTT